VSEGEGDGDPDGASPGVGGATGLADGVGVGSSAIAGVPRNDAVKATARSGGARKRCICKVSRKTARRPSESGHKSPERAGERPM
jgi:hypothetical protein